MMKDRWAYANQYKEAVDIYTKLEKEYWRIFLLNPDNYYLQKIVLDSLQNVNERRTNLYDILPEIAGGIYPQNVQPLSKVTEESTTPIPRALQN